MGRSSFRKCAICGTASRERNMRVGPMGALFCGEEVACCERARAVRGSNDLREYDDEARRWDEQFNPVRPTAASGDSEGGDDGR